eukprot:Clim_evm1s196 gene=Clim_evmTU1s196
MHSIRLVQGLARINGPKSSCAFARSPCVRVAGISMGSVVLRKGKIDRVYRGSGFELSDARLFPQILPEFLHAENIVNKAPAPIQRFLEVSRMDKPIGTWLLYLPCVWSIAAATPVYSIPDFGLMALFGAGAFIMRGAGCTINDLWDQDLDKKVARTADRPLASGKIGTLAGVGWLAAQLSAGLGVLTQLNWASIKLGASSLGLVGIYPLAKRFTNMPQLVLGLTFNWGALLGYTAATGMVDLAVTGPLYLAGVAWTMHYDTIYAHQDKEDDAKIGVKSTALFFGEYTKPYLAAFSGITTAGLLASGAAAGVGLPYYLGVTAGAGHLAWQILTVDLNSQSDCLSKFKSNRDYGLLIGLSWMVGRFFGM